MKLLATLQTGIYRARNGTVDIYARGSSTPQSYYNDFEGDSPNSGQVALDAYGMATVYVDALVRLVVKDSDGTTVADYTEGDVATAVELRSPSFTGQDYETAALAPNNPTTVDAALDRWVVSAGTTDFNVLVGSTPRSLQSFAANSQGVFFNVKNTDYSGGAKGDGITDDTSAITDAIADCEDNGGGIVWFPSGTYRVTATLSIPENVNLVGLAMDQSIISYDNTSGYVIQYSDSYIWREMRELTVRIKSGVTSTNGLVIMGQVKVRFARCEFGASSPGHDGTFFLDEIPFPAGSTEFEIDACRIWIPDGRKLFHQEPGSAGSILYSGSGRIPLRLTDSVITTTGTSVDPVVPLAGDLYMAGNTFDPSSVTGTIRFVSSGRNMLVSNNVFKDSLTSTSIIGLTVGRGTGYVVTESGNQWGQGGNPAAWLPYGSTDTDAVIESLHSRWVEIVNNSASVNLWTGTSPYSTYIVHRTGSGAQTIVIDFLIEGQTYHLLLWNDNTGVSITFTLPFLGTTSVIVATNNAVLKSYKALDVGNGALELVEVGSQSVSAITV